MSGHVVSTTIDKIHSLIMRGEIHIGGRLPSERELADMFCVSRSSVREALSEMRQRGEVESRRGRHGGTFVTTDSPYWQDRGRMDLTRESSLMVGLKAGQIWSLHNELTQQGHAIDTQIISATIERCPIEMCEMFGLVDSRSLIRIVRKRSSENEAISYEKTYFDPLRFPDMLDQDLSQSLLFLTIDHYNQTVKEVEEQVEVVAARGKTASYLEVTAGSSLLRVKLNIVDETGITMMYSDDHYRPDHVRLVIRSSS